MLQRRLVASVTPCLVLAAAAALAGTAEVTVTSLPGNVFIPEVVTIRVGDTVRWNNIAGAHNVVSDGGFFDSGSPVTAPWTFTHLFTAAGTYEYYCAPHGGPGGLGQSGTVVVLPEVEIAHGSDREEDLAGVPDVYRIGQKPYSSYEVVADLIAGNPTLRLERLDSGGVVIQAGQPVTATINMAQSLRWENQTASLVDAERVRVTNGCPAGNCSANDIYRVRAYETTLAMARYNNSGSQVSVVILQNPTDYPITGRVYFWSVAGSLVNGTGTPVTLQPKGASVVSGALVPGVPGTSGTVTVSHNGRYGDLVGKVVALEPATGFSFDTPGLVRPH